MKEIYADSETSQAFYCFKENHHERFMLRFDLANGDIISIPYRLICEVHLSGSNLTIDFVHKSIKITGNNLLKLFKAVNNKEAGKIIESHTKIDNLEDGNLFIDSIIFMDK